MMTNILRTLSLKGSKRSLLHASFLTLYSEATSRAALGTVNALIRGALHIEATVSIMSSKAMWGSIRLLDGTPPFDMAAFIKWLQENNTFDSNHRTIDIDRFIKNTKDIGAASKLKTISILSRAILSKVNKGATVYESNVTKFDETQIVCRSDNPQSDDEDEGGETSSDDDDESTDKGSSPSTTTVPWVTCYVSSFRVYWSHIFIGSWLWALIQTLISPSIVILGKSVLALQT